MPEFPVDPEYGRSISGMQDEDEKQEQLPNGEPGQVIELADGSALVVDPSPEAEVDSQFYSNLAEELPDHVLNKLATRYLELIEYDRESRKRRVEQYEEGLRRSGLSGEAPGGAKFDGASKAVHPVLVEAAIDFQSTAMRELHPPSGPVRTNIKALTTREAVLKAERKAKFLNWQLTKQIEEYRSQKEKLLAQLPFGGSQYMKWFPDDKLGRPSCEFIRLDDMLIPFSARSFYTARRQTHVLHLTQDEFDERVETGWYKDVSKSPPSMEPDATKVEEQQRKIEGKEPPSVNEDGLREDYETYTWLALEEDPLTKGRPAPYILTISNHDRQIIALYRNWREGDEKLKKLDWIVAWPFIPWDGVYDLGLYHLIGGLTIAATGTLRALLDSALVNNMPGGLRLKGAKVSGQNLNADPTQFVEVDAGPGVDDIRKLAMPFPFNPTSPVLFQLLGWLTDAAKGVITTAEEKIKDASNEMPVGTALALIEQGAKVMGSIHARLHAAQAKEFEVLSRIDEMYYTDQELAEMYGEPLVSHTEFALTDDVEPVSDPNIFSEGQRYAQAQAALQMSADPRVQYNAYELHRMTLERMKFPDIDRILPSPPKPVELNSVAENIAGVAGKPLAAFPDQDHLSHIEVHLRFCLEPFVSQDPQAVLRVYPPMVEHIRQHILFFYGKLMHNAVSAAAGVDLDEILGQSKEAYKVLDAAFAAASDKVSTELRSALADTQVLGLMNQMSQIVQQLMPPTQKDPAVMAVEAALKETERRAQRDKQEMILAMKDQAEESQRKTAEMKSEFMERMATAQFDKQRIMMEMSSQAEETKRNDAEMRMQFMEKMSELQQQSDAQGLEQKKLLEELSMERAQFELDQKKLMEEIAVERTQLGLEKQRLGIEVLEKLAGIAEKLKAVEQMDKEIKAPKIVTSK